MSKENYESLRTVLAALPADAVSEPTIPVPISVQEAEDLVVWCSADRDALTKAGLNWQLVDSLPVRIGAARYIQSDWQREYNSQADAQRRWKEQSPAGYELRDELVHHCLHAFFALPDLYAHTQRIAEGSGAADMIQDLSDLAALGRANRQPLEKVGVNMALFDQAATLSASLSDLLAQSNGERLSGNKLKDARDRAYSYMKQAVDEIRRHGQYVFYRNDARKKGYVSRYAQQKHTRWKNNKSDNEAAQ